ncbi:MAG: hypothetical protein AB8G22_19535, partial [Saprospiraceae bacterium]
RNAIRANDFAQFDVLVKEFLPTNFLERLRVSRACLLADFYAKNEQYQSAIALFKLIAEQHPDDERPLQGLENAQTKLRK